MSEQKKFILDEAKIPTSWYNIVPDLPVMPEPPLNPETLKPAGPSDLEAIFPPSIIAQEVSTERYHEIPEEVQEVYRLWRPAPLIRASALEKALDTPAKIFFKYEGVSPAGSHKTNTAIAQAYYNKKDGITRLATETGAGQWGAALAYSTHHFGLECFVYMVKVSYQQKPYRRSMMQLWGADVIPSPSDTTEVGRKIIADDPETLGSLGMAISEAIEDTVTHPGTKYALGSVTNHVLLHQTVVGEEALLQMQEADAYPDVVIGCVGGGSSFGGIAFPFLRENLAGKAKTRLLGVEPTACPTLTKGKFVYDHGDEAQMTPLFKMYSLGHDFVPAGIHAGGLRYHGMAPLVSHVYDLGLMDAVAVPQTKCFEAAQLFTQTEGIVPAPESSHAICVAIDEALKAKEEGVSKTLLFNLTGHGFLDLSAYDAFLAGKLEDYDHPEAAIEASIAKLPRVD